MVGSIHIDKSLGVEAAIFTSIILASCAAPQPWQVYAFQDGAFAALPGLYEPPVSPSVAPAPLLPTTPSDWDITASTLADITGDGEP